MPACGSWSVIYSPLQLPPSYLVAITFHLLCRQVLDGKNQVNMGTHKYARHWCENNIGPEICQLQESALGLVNPEDVLEVCIQNIEKLEPK